MGADDPGSTFELPLFTRNQGFGPLRPDWHDKLLHARRVYRKNTDEEKKGAPFLLILVEPGRTIRERSFSATPGLEILFHRLLATCHKRRFPVRSRDPR